VRYLLDEAHELQGAVLDGDPGAVDEELADVLFIYLFALGIHGETRPTSLDQVASMGLLKLRRRHAHLLSGRVETVEDQNHHWEKVKREERGKGDGDFEPPSEGLPPLRRALAVQERAAALAFDWPDVRGILRKLREESDELVRELDGSGPDRLRDEVGDLLFTLVNLARRLEIDPDAALESTNRKFIRRLGRMEARLRERGGAWRRESAEVLEELWEEVKAEEGPPAGSST
jgi:MazG family protein